MKFQIILFLSLSAINFSCKRENCPFPGTTVEGAVIEDSTNVSIKGVTVYLQRRKCKRDFMSSVCSCSDIKNVETDENGMFMIQFCKSKNRDYAIAFKKTGYSPSEHYDNCGGGCGICLDDFLNSDRIIKLKQ